MSKSKCKLKLIGDKKPEFISTLVGDASSEYFKKREEVMADLEARAQALFGRIAPDHVKFALFYHAGNNHVFCDIDNLLEGFGTLLLSFHKGVAPEADFFLVKDFMELTSPTPIYTLYDLGQVLTELTEKAEEILRSFRQSVIEQAETHVVHYPKALGR